MSDFLFSSARRPDAELSGLLDRFVGIVIGAGSGLVVAALFRRAP